MASPTLGRLYPGEIPRYSFYRKLSGPQGQSEHEGVKKNLHPSDTRDRTRAVQAHSQAPCRLSHLAHHKNVIQNQNIVIGNLSFENVEKFRYLGVTVG